MDSKIANDVFRYDKDMGVLYWKIKPSIRVAVGDEIKTDDGSGYLVVKYKGRRYYVHRIIWLMVYGNWPNGHIDHIDHDRKNNRLANLRDVDTNSNQRNTKIPVNNTSGFLGVSFYKKSQKWQATGTTLDGLRKHIGYFDRIEDAIEARKAFNRDNDYHPNHESQ